MGGLRRRVEIGAERRRRQASLDLGMIHVEQTKQEESRLYSHRPEVVTLRGGTTLKIGPIHPEVETSNSDGYAKRGPVVKA
jgi:hypothetical protein